MSGSNNWLKSAVLFGLSLLFSCAAAELAFRLLKPQPTYSALIELAGTYYAPSDYNTFQLKSDYRGSEPSMEFPGLSVAITTNPDRFRGAALDSNKDKILILGDSYTFGVYVNDSETYPAILDSLISKVSDHFQVINAGYTDGWETDQQYVWLKRNIGILHPRLVMLSVFLGNDITGIDTEAWADIDPNGLPGKWLSKNLTVTGAGYIKNKNTGNSTVGIEAIYRFPALRESHLAIAIGKLWDKLTDVEATNASQEIGESFDHIFGRYSTDFLQKEAIFLRLVKAIGSLCQEEGSLFVVALLPMNVMVEREKSDLTATYGRSVLAKEFENAESVYYARLSKLLEEMSIPTIDIERAMKASNAGPFFPANGEVHFNPRGHQFTAERIFDFLRPHIKDGK